MKTFIIFLFYSITSSLVAQDYYKITTENNVVYNYPKNVTISFTDENDREVTFISGKKYKEISIKTSWGEEVETYKNAIIELIERNTPYYVASEKPKLLQKNIVKSTSNHQQYNLEAVFSNNLIFSFNDGRVSATQNGVALEIKNKYLVLTNEGLFKISFHPKNGEFWYVIER